jgi:hypothetical protein
MSSIQTNVIGKENRFAARPGRQRRSSKLRQAVPSRDSARSRPHSRDTRSQPFHERSVHLGRLLLRHPVARSNRLFRKVATVLTHRLREPRMSALADVIVTSVEKQRRHIEIAVVARRLRILGIRAMVQIPRCRSKKTVALQGRNVNAKVLFTNDICVGRQIGDCAATHSVIASRTRRERRPPSPKPSTRPRRGSNRPSAVSSASSVSPYDAKRPPPTSDQSSASPPASA